MAEVSKKSPEHEAIYQKLKNMILFGEFVPGQALTIMGVQERLSAGMTPVREAIRRLTAEQALQALENRRVAVPVMSLDQLDDIAMIRKLIEPELARRAVKYCQQDTIERLARLDAQVDAAIAQGDVGGYLQANYQFHFTLYDLAQSPTLLHVAASLWLKNGPSLRIICGRIGTANLGDHHASAIKAVERGDGEGAAKAIFADITEGIAVIRRGLSA